MERQLLRAKCPWMRPRTWQCSEGGALPVNLKPAEYPQCEPDLEKESSQELECRAVGTGLVLLFMLFYINCRVWLQIGFITSSWLPWPDLVQCLPFPDCRFVPQLGNGSGCQRDHFERIREELNRQKASCSYLCRFSQSLDCILTQLTTLITAAVSSTLAQVLLKVCCDAHHWYYASLFTCIVITRWILKLLLIKPQRMIRSF